MTRTNLIKIVEVCLMLNCLILQYVSFLYFKNYWNAIIFGILIFILLVRWLE